MGSVGGWVFVMDVGGWVDGHIANLTCGVPVKGGMLGFPVQIKRTPGAPSLPGNCVRTPRAFSLFEPKFPTLMHPNTCPMGPCVGCY